MRARRISAETTRGSAAITRAKRKASAGNVLTKRHTHLLKLESRRLCRARLMAGLRKLMEPSESIDQALVRILLCAQKRAPSRAIKTAAVVKADFAMEATLAAKTVLADISGQLRILMQMPAFSR